MSYFVELVGPPGSGKTTFVTATATGSGGDTFVNFNESTFLAICWELNIRPDEARSAKQFKFASKKNNPKFQKHVIDHVFRRSKRGVNRLAYFCALFPRLIGRVSRKLSAVDDEDHRKTTISRLLALGALDPRFLKPDTRIQKLIDFCCRNPLHLQEVFQILEATGHYIERKIIVGWLFDVYVRYQYFTSMPSDERYLLMDEGFTGRVVTLFAYQANQPTPETIRNYVRTVPRPVAVINLRQDIHICHQRLISRPSGPPGRFKSLTHNRQLQVLRSSQECIDIALSELAALGVPSIEINSTLDPQEQVRIAVAALTRLTNIENSLGQRPAGSPKERFD